MGSVNHPIAELARQAVAARDFKRANALIDAALKDDPAQPDLACEAAILAIYAAKEEWAFELLPISESGCRFAVLTSLLADHYTSRIMFDKTDHDAKRRLQLLRTFYPTISNHIGVKVCACLIVKDEEKALGRCLESLHGVVDQIVVVDTGSNDGTIELARRHGARVAEFEWCEDFSAARNFALSLATANWILSIDADEEVGAETKNALDRAVIRPQFGGFDIEIVNYLGAGVDGDQFRHCPTRLFRNLPGVQFSGRVHEQINPSLVELGLPWARLEGASILHHGYRPEVMDEKGKIDRTIDLLEKEVKDDPGNSFQWFNLANAYLVAKRPKDATSAAQESVRLLNSNSGFGIQAYSVLIQSLQATARFEEGLEAAEMAEERGFGCLQIAFEKCNILMASGQSQEAFAYAPHMMSLGWPNGSTGDIGIFTHKRFVVYAQVLARAQKYSEALAQVEKALVAAPNYGPAHFIRAQIYEKLDRFESAIESFQQSSKDASCFLGAKREVVRLLGRQNKFEAAAHISFQIWMNDVRQISQWKDWKKQCESTGNPLLVLECYEQLSALQPVSAELLVDWGRCCATCGRNPQALRCFAEAIRLSPTSSNAYFNAGDLLYRLEMYPQSVEMFSSGLKHSPDYLEGWFVLGNALARSGRETEAVEVFEKVLLKEPRHERAKQNLIALRAA
jgi:tetratricopeptide (TPR) repeat protein